MLFLVVVVLTSFALRYPLVEHERYQTDSYTIHLLSKSIVDNGYAKWIFHPLSYFGYYPLSYPSGTPFLLAELSDLTGLSMEPTILVMNMSLAVLFCLGVFVLARQFLSRPEYALLAALFAVLGSRFVDTTYWDASARGLMIVLMVVSVFAAFRGSAMSCRLLFGLALLAGLACFAAHHMAVLLILFGLGYILAAFQSQYLYRRLRMPKRKIAVVYNVLIAIIIASVAFTYVGLFGHLVELNFQKSSLFDIDPPILSVLLNSAAGYTNQIGFVLVFAVLGLPSFFRYSALSTENLFPLTLVISFIPLLGNSLYVSMIISPFVAVLGTMWIAQLFQNKRRRTAVVLVTVILICSSVALPIWSTARWNNGAYVSGDTVEVDSQVFNDAIYLGIDHEGNWAACNANVVQLELAANSDTKFVAPGVALALNGDLTGVDVSRNVSWSSASFPVNIYLWFEYVNEPKVDYYVWWVMTYGAGILNGTAWAAPASDYFSTHSRLLVVIDNDWPNGFVDVYGARIAIFPSELKNASWTMITGSKQVTMDLKSYKSYESEKTSMYVVELPV